MHTALCSCGQCPLAFGIHLLLVLVPFDTVVLYLQFLCQRIGLPPPYIVTIVGPPQSVINVLHVYIQYIHICVYRYTFI